MSPPAEVTDQLCSSLTHDTCLRRFAVTLLMHAPNPLFLSLKGPWVGPVQSRDTNNWYPHYSEVKGTSLLKYKLTPLNYYFLFVTTFIY